MTSGSVHGYIAHPKYNGNNDCMLVDWEEEHFADNGDCGAVYYYMLEGRRVPVAVHVGSARTRSGRKVSLGAMISDKDDFGGYSVFFYHDRHRNLHRSDFNDELEMF
jgi:hypothetical protein